MLNDSIRVFAPASISNVGPGFDIMGFALNEPGDEIILRKRKDRKLFIKKITGTSVELPYQPKLNTATAGIINILKEKNLDYGIDVEIHKKMGIGSGLGSSAASAVGGVFAINELLSLKLTHYELLKYSLVGESIASKAIHADNVAPCLYGGFILVRSYDPIDIVRIEYPKNIFCSIVYPGIVIKTSEARKLLSKMVSLKKAVSQAGNAAGLIAGLMKNDMGLIKRSMVDHIAESKRSKLIPYYDEIRKAAFNAGAMNCNITGSGPSMFAFSTSRHEAEKIAAAMSAVVLGFGHECIRYISGINSKGPKILG